MQIVTTVLPPLLPWMLVHCSFVELSRPTDAFQAPSVLVTSTMKLSLTNRIRYTQQRYCQRRILFGGIVSSKPVKRTCSLRTLPNDEETIKSERRRRKRSIPLDDHDDDDDDSPSSSSFGQLKLYQKDELMTMPISILLSELEIFNIRISPTATREELVELLLLEYQSIQNDNVSHPPNQKSFKDNYVDDDGNLDDFVNREKQIKDKGIDANGKYNEARQKTPSPHSGSTVETNVPRRRKQMDDAARKRRNRRKRIEHNRSIEDSTRLSLDKAIGNIIPSVQEAETWSRKVVKDVNRVAKRATKTVGKRINDAKPSLKIIREGLKDIVDLDDETNNYGGDDDANGVKEVDWYYVSKEDVRTKRSRPIRTVRKVRKIRRQGYRVPIVSNNHDTGVHGSDTQMRNRMALPERLDGVVYFPNVDDRSNQVVSNEDVEKKAKILDSNDLSKNQNDGAPASSSRSSSSRSPYDNRKRDTFSQKDAINNASRSRRSSSTSPLQNRTQASARKKIYSVYPQNDSNDNSMDLEELYGRTAANAIDTVGEFLVDVISGDKSSFENGTAYPKKAGDMSSFPTKEREKKSTSPRRRYWKDRLAEKVDYALGVHEDAGYYKSWQDQLDRQRAMESDTRDPVSIFYGNQKKRQREKKKTGPFWEEDGSLMSLFLGRNKKGRELTFHKLFERDFSVNILLKTVLKSFIAVLSYICRWASCRGALPQPIVVFVFVASALSAPRRKKVMTAFLALIATRTVAEAVHGYVYGNDDWEDEDVVTNPDKEPNI